MACDSFLLLASLATPLNVLKAVNSDLVKGFMFSTNASSLHYHITLETPRIKHRVKKKTPVCHHVPCTSDTMRKDSLEPNIHESKSLEHCNSKKFIYCAGTSQSHPGGEIA